MFTAKDQRADLIRDFPQRRAMYAIDFGQLDPVVSPTSVSYVPFRMRLESGLALSPEKSREAFAYCFAGGNGLKNLRWDEDNWLSEKSDAFQRSYIAAARNIDALRLVLAALKAGETPNIGNRVCEPTIAGDAAFSNAYNSIVIPNAPKIYLAHVERTIHEDQFPADYRGNWFVGMCLASNCKGRDLVPRNTSIWYDAIAPEMTEGQAQAIRAMDATGTPEFWIAAAHANGIDRDGPVALYAKQDRKLVSSALGYHATGNGRATQMFWFVLFLIAATPVLIVLYAFRDVLRALGAYAYLSVADGIAGMARFCKRISGSGR
jgi:hypothetical protein